MPKPLIFISHIHQEQEIAILLEKELARIFLEGVEFFVSSDRRSLRGGDDWLREIKRALTEAAIVLALVSPRSVDKTWINFESGAAWLHKRIIPLCHSGLKPSQLPQPMQSLVGFDLHEPIDLKDLFQLIGDAAGLRSPANDWQVLARSISEVTLKFGALPTRPYGAHSCWVFPRSEDIGTVGALEKSLAQCSAIKIYSVGANFLWSATHLEMLEERIVEKLAAARICMADFTSNGIRSRMEEEPEHPIGVPGSEHLIRRLIRLESRVADPSRFSLRVFAHYPTYAMLGFDDQVYVYPYGYRSLGNYSPTFYWAGNDPAAKFFHDQFELVWHDARPAADVYG
jgi:hypothetical protein